MSELIDLAFLFCSRAQDKGLKKYEILWLTEQQIERLYRIENFRQIEEQMIKENYKKEPYQKR